MRVSSVMECIPSQWLVIVDNEKVLSCWEVNRATGYPASKLFLYIVELKFYPLLTPDYCWYTFESSWSLSSSAAMPWIGVGELQWSQISYLGVVRLHPLQLSLVAFWHYQGSLMLLLVKCCLDIKDNYPLPRLWSSIFGSMFGLRCMAKWSKFKKKKLNLSRKWARFWRPSAI